MLIKFSIVFILVSYILTPYCAGRHLMEDARSEYTKSEDIDDNQPDDYEADFEEAGHGEDDSDNYYRRQREEYQEMIDKFQEPLDECNHKFDSDGFSTQKEDINKHESTEFLDKPHKESQQIISNDRLLDHIPFDHTERLLDPIAFDVKKNDICVTPECVTTAATFIERMNISVDPCDDFYEYACGRFPDVQEMYEDMPRVMSFELLRRKNSYDLKRILTKLDTKQIESKAISNVKALYDSCMNLSLMDNKGVEPILNQIKTYGDWPLLNKRWKAASWNFKETLSIVNVFSPTTAFFSIDIGLDAKDAVHYIMKISQKGIYLPKEYYESTNNHELKAVAAYGNLMQNTVKLLGFSGAKVEESMRKVLKLEKELAKIHISSTKARANVDKMYKKVDFKYLTELYPQIDWMSLLRKFMKVANVDAKASHTVVIDGEIYFKRLMELIKRTDKETLANYIFWRLTAVFASFGPQNIKDELFKFHKAYYGTQAKPPRWKTCLGVTQSWLKFALGRIYVDNKFNFKSKEEAKEIINEIRRQFIKNLKQVEWMDKETKKKAKEKAEAVLPLIGYPIWLHDDNKLNKYYRMLKLTHDDYLGNYIQLIYNSLKKRVTKLIKWRRDRHEWTTAPSVVNAFYSQLYNRIVFPAGILQKNFYDEHYPLSVNYGGIGSVIGHEFTHGFDDLGRKYDKNGNMHHWWKESSIKEFEERADCYRTQYSSFQIYGAHMNGNLSCGENIADNGGIKLAYLAYKSKYSTSSENSKKKLPGLQHLSHDQLFFLAFARNWCVQEYKTKTLKGIFTDHHSYPKFRVHGTISNSADFAKAYNCKLNSAMNPKKKCVIW